MDEEDLFDVVPDSSQKVIVFVVEVAFSWLLDVATIVVAAAKPPIKANRVDDDDDERLFKPTIVAAFVLATVLWKVLVPTGLYNTR